MADLEKFAEEDAEGYAVVVIGRNVLVSEAMKNYAWDKLDKIERFHDHVMHVTVTLDIERTEQICSILLKIDHLEVMVKASTTDMYASIDEAIKRLQTKLRRFKNRIQDHHRKKLSVVDMKVNVFQRPYDETGEYNAEIEAENKKRAGLIPPKIIGTDTLPLKMLTPDEAIMKMELSEHPFLIYKDEVDQKIKVLYRRTDGNYGLVQPE